MCSTHFQLNKLLYDFYFYMSFVWMCEVLLFVFVFLFGDKNNFIGSRSFSQYKENHLLVSMCIYKFEWKYSCKERLY